MLSLDGGPRAIEAKGLVKTEAKRRTGELLEVYAVGPDHQDPTTRSVDAPIPAGSHPIGHVVRDLAATGVRTPSLDDVFLTLTGHAAERPFLHDTDGAAGVHGKETA
ncbi:MAG: hypothetical protein ACRD0V_07440 [Acidimicrobiales bacterium]